MCFYSKSKLTFVSLTWRLPNIKDSIKFLKICQELTFPLTELFFYSRKHRGGARNLPTGGG